MNPDTATRSSVMKLGEEPIITITAERAANKKVTLIRGAEKLQIDHKDMLKYLKLKLAASGTIHEAGAGGGKVIMVQGKHLDAVKKIFSEEFSLPEKQIKIIDKIGEGKKKGKKKH